MVTRRTVLAVPPSLAVGAAGSATAQGSGATAGAAGQAPGFYRYRIGAIEVTAIHDGHGQRPLENFIRNADLADVKGAMAEAFLSPEGPLLVPYTSLVFRTGGRTVLVDVGNGDSGPPTSGTWMANFKAAGFDPAAEMTIVISHMHGDHYNGLRLKDGTAVFPNATVMVARPEWAHWMDDAVMAAAPEAARGGFANARRVFRPMADSVRFYEADQEVAPGITARAAFGHSPGHMTFDVVSGDSRLRLMSDITNHPALFVRNPTWSAVFDADPDRARATRLAYLDRAATERVQVAFYHAPFPATGHIARDGDRFRFVPVQWNGAA